MPPGTAPLEVEPAGRAARAGGSMRTASGSTSASASASASAFASVSSDAPSHTGAEGGASTPGAAVSAGPHVLHVKACSGRNLTSQRRVMNLYLRFTWGESTQKTSVRKNCGDRPFWNQPFVFLVQPPSASVGTEDSGPRTLLVEVKHRELFATQVLGNARVALPDTLNQLVDVWVPLLDPATATPTGADVHLCMQVEPLGERSPALLRASTMQSSTTGGAASHGPVGSKSNAVAVIDEYDAEEVEQPAAAQQSSFAGSRVR